MWIGEGLTRFFANSLASLAQGCQSLHYFGRVIVCADSPTYSFECTCNSRIESCQILWVETTALFRSKILVPKRPVMHQKSCAMATEWTVEIMVHCILLGLCVLYRMELPITYRRLPCLDSYETSEPVSFFEEISTTWARWLSFEVDAIGWSEMMCSKLQEMWPTREIWSTFSTFANLERKGVLGIPVVFSCWRRFKTLTGYV